MGNGKMNWVINIILGILITLAVLCLIQIGYGYYHGWY